MCHGELRVAVLEKVSKQKSPEHQVIYFKTAIALLCNSILTYGFTEIRTVLSCLGIEVDKFHCHYRYVIVTLCNE